MTIDLRSDTLTKPTPGMLEAMFSAPVGDDVYGEDESVNTLQTKIAEMFGMEAAIFCPSGTMTNQIAINVLTHPRDEVICFEGSHIYKYEGGGLFSNSGVSIKLVSSEQYGRLSPEQVAAQVNPDDVHFPITTLVSLENTVNRGGGSCYTLGQITAIHKVCQAHQLKLHLDGARLFNALVATGDKARDYGKYFDTISICLSKSLGCPVGSVLLGSEAAIKKAKRVRKAFGGGMRQAGYLAAAGIYALDHHIDRLEEDHLKARKIAEHLQGLPFVQGIDPVETNIVIFKGQEEILDKFIAHCAAHEIKMGRIDRRKIRLVTHLDFHEEMLERLLAVIQSFKA